MENHDHVGTAYGFFYCPASKQEVKRALPTLRKMAKTPSLLELQLFEGMDTIPKEILDKERLAVHVEEARRNGINYLLKAEYSGGTNENTANELADIINQAYQSPLYGNEPFKGTVLYEKNGEYASRE